MRGGEKGMKKVLRKNSIKNAGNAQLYASEKFGLNIACNGDPSGVNAYGCSTGAEGLNPVNCGCISGLPNWLKCN